MKISYTTNGVTFEVDTVSELTALGEKAPEVFTAVTAIKQAGYAVGALAASEGKNTPDVKAKAATAPPAGDVPSCDHGPKKDLLGQLSKSGAPYKFRYYCAADRDDPTKCNPAGSNS